MEIALGRYRWNPGWPCAIAAGPTSVCLDGNGMLWTWGPRLGYLYPSQVTNKVQQAVIRARNAVGLNADSKAWLTVPYTFLAPTERQRLRPSWVAAMRS